MTTTRRTRTTRTKTLRATRTFYFNFKSLFDKTIPQIYAIFCDRNAFPQKCSSNIRDIFLSEMLFPKSVPQIYEIFLWSKIACCFTSKIYDWRWTITTMYLQFCSSLVLCSVVLGSVPLLLQAPCLAAALASATTMFVTFGSSLAFQAA